ncbi:MAG: TIGR02450 family Trp-rich protein [Bradymonadaceae bacterium]
MSHWTAVEPDERRKHWEVVRYAHEDGEVTLRAVLDGETVTIPWRELRDREVWTPGWE